MMPWAQVGAHLLLPESSGKPHKKRLIATAQFPHVKDAFISSPLCSHSLWYTPLPLAAGVSHLAIFFRGMPVWDASKNNENSDICHVRFTYEMPTLAY